MSDIKKWTRHRDYKQRGFTIVELLIVIVVIAILATISIVTYDGIQERARASATSSALTQAAKKVALWQIDNSGVPADEASFNRIVGNTSGSSGSSVTYQYCTTDNGANYCITATSGPTSYRITNNDTSSQGACPGHGAGGQPVVTNLILNPNTEGSSGWNVGGVASGSYTSGFDGVTRAYWMTRTGSGAAVLRGDASLVANTTYTALLTLRSNVGTTVTLQLRGSASSGMLLRSEQPRLLPTNRKQLG